MPNTRTPIFDLGNAEKVRMRNEKADEELGQVILDIQNRKTGSMMHRAVPYLIRYISDITYNAMRKTKHFSVEESCIGCGQCERNCPASAIQLENGKPVLVKERCVMCLRCLHYCPKFAIQYGLIVLCADKSDTLVEYTLPEDNRQIFAAKYLPYMPTKEELKLDDFEKLD